MNMCLDTSRPVPISFPHKDDLFKILKKCKLDFCGKVSSTNIPPVPDTEVGDKTQRWDYMVSILKELGHTNN